MRVHRIYVDAELQADSEIALPAEAGHHLASVLRVKTGQRLALFNNTGIEADASIVAIERKTVRVSIENTSLAECESPLKIHLAIGVSRGDRMDFVLQKSVELGVHAITPLLCERTEVKLAADREQKKILHWKKIIINACEQCGRTRLPVLNEPLSLAALLRQDNSESKFVLHHRSEQSLSTSTKKPLSACLLIGPEGGLSAQEITQAQTAGFQALTLGPRVMRTETAPIAALSILQYQWGDLG
jgi:16S rRNA (uracil1498-N3)-methyltransferase